VTCWAIIPVKGTDLGKQRLAAVLDGAGRQDLVAAMLGHVVAVVEGAEGIDRVALLGSSRHRLPESLELLPDPGTGLNAALTSAFAMAAQAGATRVVIIFADLPQLTSAEVALLAGAPHIAAAPDRHGTGTNALSLPLPAARGFTFAFGPDSFARHGAEAARIGLPLVAIRSPGLQRDIDEPADLPDAAGLTGE
jgi:2-phospho-L-lactate guanylyltransferase